MDPPKGWYALSFHFLHIFLNYALIASFFLQFVDSFGGVKVKKGGMRKDRILKDRVGKVK